MLFLSLARRLLNRFSFAFFVAFFSILFFSGFPFPKVSLAYSAEKIDANSATQEELEALPGIGETIAKRIISARVMRPFESMEDLSGRVKGLGKKKMEKLQAAGFTLGKGVDSSSLTAGTLGKKPDMPSESKKKSSRSQKKRRQKVKEQRLERKQAGRIKNESEAPPSSPRNHAEIIEVSKLTERQDLIEVASKRPMVVEENRGQIASGENKKIQNSQKRVSLKLKSKMPFGSPLSSSKGGHNTITQVSRVLPVEMAQEKASLEKVEKVKKLEEKARWQLKFQPLSSGAPLLSERKNNLPQMSFEESAKHPAVKEILSDRLMNGVQVIIGREHPR